MAPELAPIWIGAVAIALSSCSPRAEPVAENGARGEAFVRSFFDAFDRRDLQAIESSFLPGAKIVHDDGVVTDIPTMLEIIRNTSEWPPRERRISGCNSSAHGRVLVVGCLNEVTFDLDDRAAVPFAYYETWILEDTGAGLKAIRSHYSRVTKEEHSEEV